MCDDGTIGDVSSGASNLASATTSSLFALLWANFANTEAAVSSGRGASAVADYAAHKTIALPKMLGRVYGIAGSGSGLSGRSMGEIAGAENHTLTVGEIPPLTGATNSAVVTSVAPVNTTINYSAGPSPASVTTSISVAGPSIIGISTDGNSNPHSSMQPTVFLKMMVKL